MVATVIALRTMRINDDLLSIIESLINIIFTWFSDSDSRGVTTIEAREEATELWYNKLPPVCKS